jgi:hypothetical protein
LNDVMNALPADLFAGCFTAWVEGLRERAPDIVAIDGKTSRRARAKGSDPLYLVSAWASRQRLVLGQEAVAEKSNEINAVPLLLARPELQGALVTIERHGLPDRDRKGHPRQGSRLPPRAEVRRAFDTAPAGTLATHVTTDATTAASRSATPSSATTSAGSPPTGASPANGASRIWR